MIKKILIWFLMIIIIGLLGFGGWLYYNREKIETTLIEIINESLSVPFTVEKTRIDPFSKFPLIALELKNVYSPGSGESSKSPLIQMEKISLGVEFWDLIRGNPVIRHIFMENGEITILDPRNEIPNYKILKDTPSLEENEEENKGLEVEELFLKNVSITYTIPDQGINISVLSEKMMADLLIENGLLQAGVNFKGRVSSVFVNKREFVDDKEVNFQGLLFFDKKKSQFYFDDLKLFLEGLPLLSDLKVDWEKEIFLDLRTDLISSKIQDVEPHLPSEVTSILKELKLKGKVSGNVTIKGKISPNDNPTFRVSVPLKDIEINFFDSISNKPMVKNGTFSYISPNFFQDLSDHLILKDLEVLWNNKTIKGNFEIPKMSLDDCRIQFGGDIELETILSLAEIKDFSKPKGSINFDIEYSGPLVNKQEVLLENSKVNGNAKFQDLGFLITKRNLEAERFSGSLEFNNEVLAVTDLSGDFGESDLKINGYALNFLNYMFRKNQPLHLEAIISSSNLILEDFLRSALDTSEYVFTMNPLISMVVKPKIQKFRFKNFHAQNISGKVHSGDQKIKAREIKMDFANGKLEVDIELDASDSTQYYWWSEFLLKDLMLDSTFKNFNNFGQTFLKSENLKGKFNARGELFLSSDKYLVFNPDSIQANVEATVKDGELNYFEPIKKFKKYLNKKEDLDHIKFQELKNNFIVKEKRVLIPKMEIGSNVKNVVINGYQNFDHSFKYHFQIPIFGKNKKDKDEQYGIVEDASDVSFLYLVLEGSPDDYRVDYDKKALLGKIQESLFIETRDALDLFRKKKKNKKVVLEEDEYFEIDQ